MSAISNRREKDKKNRARLRKRLEAAGVDQAEIDKIIAQKRDDDRYRREQDRYPVPTRDEILAHTDDSLWPDDTRYRPKRHDPLLHGPARPTGIAAKVSKRRHTITEYQHEKGDR